MPDIVIPRFEIGALFKSKDLRDRGRVLRIKERHRVPLPGGGTDVIAHGYWVCEPVTPDGSRVTSQRTTVLHERTLCSKFRFIQPSAPPSTA